MTIRKTHPNKYVKKSFPARTLKGLLRYQGALTRFDNLSHPTHKKKMLYKDNLLLFVTSNKEKDLIERVVYNHKPQNMNKTAKLKQK